jgi:YD repeat-containing protein
MSAPRFRYVIAVAVAMLALFASGNDRAGAATAITEPRGSPYRVQFDPQGKPKRFTIVVTGFPAGSIVYVEQCDARPTSAPDWAPTRDCDIGTSPAPAIVDPTGRAEFVAGDRNHSFQPFVGLGPQGMFSCLTPNSPSATNGLPEYRTCQVRVSSNNNQTTADQVFLPLTFGRAPADAPASTPAGESASNATLPVVLTVVVLLMLVGAGIATAYRRRTFVRRG